jgi:NTE family protein
MMRKIKNLQFIRDVYGKNKTIAYFSIDWEYEKIVSGFVRSIKEGKVSEEIVAYYKIKDTQISEMSDKNFIEHIKEQIKFNDIVIQGITDEEIKYISKIKTNLTALTSSDIDLLSKHASTLLELQLNLYCPNLITRNNEKEA